MSVLYLGNKVDPSSIAGSQWWPIWRDRATVLHESKGNGGCVCCLWECRLQLLAEDVCAGSQGLHKAQSLTSC